MGIMANGGEPDGMPQNAALRLGLHCWSRQNLSSEKEMKPFFKKLYLVTSQYPDLTLSTLYHMLWKIPFAKF